VAWVAGGAALHWSYAPSLAHTSSRPRRTADDAAGSRQCPPARARLGHRADSESVPRPLTPQARPRRRLKPRWVPPGGIRASVLPDRYPPCAMGRRADLRPAAAAVSGHARGVWLGLSLATASDPPSTHHDLRRATGVSGNTGCCLDHSTRLATHSTPVHPVRTRHSGHNPVRPLGACWRRARPPTARCPARPRPQHARHSRN
jgi:hypothetical protein